MSALDRTHLDERLGGLDKVSLALGRRSLLSPVDDGLVGNTVLVVENLEDLRECLDDPRLGVAVYLRGVDERDLSLGGRAEGFHQRSVGLRDKSASQ